MKTNMVFFVSTDMTGESPESTIDNISAWNRDKQAWHKKSVWNAFSVLWSEGKLNKPSFQELNITQS